MRAKQLINFEHKTITIEGYLVATKNTKTANRKHMFFGTFLDYDGDFIDTVHFPPVAAKYPFRGNGIYTITGKVMIEFDCVTIEVSEMQRAAIIEDPRYAVQSKNNTFQNKKSFEDHKAASLTHKVSRTHKTFKS